MKMTGIKFKKEDQQNIVEGEQMALPEVEKSLSH